MTDTAEIRRKNDRMAGAQPDRKAVDLGEKKLSPEELKALQQTELSILEEADRICRENGIHYNIIAGTLLGARRHGGFIPWDDDVDIALLRPEYERFRLACQNEPPDSLFYFQDICDTDGYRWGYGKLRRKGTLFQRSGQEHMPYAQGICIDVFPLDHVPESWLGRQLRCAECFLLRKTMWAHVGAETDKNAVRRFVFRLMDALPEKQLRLWYRNLVRRTNRKRTSWVRILTFPAPNRQQGYRTEWYENSIGTLFEGRVFPGIREYDAYLTFKFGNWRCLPPEKDRKTHPVTDIRFPQEG